MTSVSPERDTAYQVEWPLACFGFGVTLVAFRVGEELLLGMNKQPEFHRAWFFSISARRMAHRSPFAVLQKT